MYKEGESPPQAFLRSLYCLYFPYFFFRPYIFFFLAFENFGKCNFPAIYIWAIFFLYASRQYNSMNRQSSTGYPPPLDKFLATPAVDSHNLCVMQGFGLSWIKYVNVHHITTDSSWNSFNTPKDSIKPYWPRCTPQEKESLLYVWWSGDSPFYTRCREDFEVLWPCAFSWDLSDDDGIERVWTLMWKWIFPGR